MSARIPNAPQQADLFENDLPASRESPSGLSYHDGIISPLEELELIGRFDALQFKPFEFHGFLGKRHVVSFGYHYDFVGRALQISDPIPPFLRPLSEKAADLAGISATSLQ